LRFVSGQAVIIGRKSFEIFGADLPEGTTVIVVTRSASIPGAQTAQSLADALSLADNVGQSVFVAGGGSIYEQALPHADEMYLSTIKGDFEGDTYFPEFDLSDWEIAEERDEAKFVFRKYRRQAQSE